MRLHGDVTIHPTRSGGISLRRGSRRVPAPRLNAHEIELVRIWCGESRPASESLVRTISATGMCLAGFEEFVQSCQESGLIQDEESPSRAGFSTVEDHPLRRLSTVGVLGLDVIGIGLALGLAEAGIGHIKLSDSCPITSFDTHLGWYQGDEIGARREHRAALRIRELLPETQVATGDLEGCDLVILVGPSAVAAHSSARFISDGTTHFAVCASSDSVDVGPVVVPGTTACLHCVNLHRIGSVLGTDQLDLTEKRNRLIPLNPRHHRINIPLAMTGIAQGVAMALRTIDDSPPPHMVTAASPECTLEIRCWDSHSDCGCMDFAPALRSVRTTPG